jgi:predicted kinase
MSKLIVLVGISNSGKSTYAAELVQDNPGEYLRVNRDDIRQLLYGYTDQTINEYYLREDFNRMEREVTRFEDTLIYEGIEMGKTVIVDATHLQRKYIERFKYWNVPTELKFFPINLDNAVFRDVNRARQVGRDIMTKQSRQFNSLLDNLLEDPLDFTPFKLDNNQKNLPCVVFDIDGCLAHKNERNPFDWKRVGEDEVDSNMSDMAGIVELAHRAIQKVIPGGALVTVIATGRDEVCETETKQWLNNHEIHYDDIHMRKRGDNRPDWVVKQEMAQKICEDFHIIGWFDDRLQVTRRLRAIGVKVFNVEHNNF